LSIIPKAEAKGSVYWVTEIEEAVEHYVLVLSNSSAAAAVVSANASLFDILSSLS